MDAIARVRHRLRPQRIGRWPRGIGKSEWRQGLILFCSMAGFWKPKKFEHCLLQQLKAWFAWDKEGTANSWEPVVLQGNRLDLAVAQGAAYFGLVRRGEGSSYFGSAGAIVLSADSRQPSSSYLLGARGRGSGKSFRPE